MFPLWENLTFFLLVPVSSLWSSYLPKVREERLVLSHHFRGFQSIMVGKVWQGLGRMELAPVALLSFADQGQM